MVLATVDTEQSKLTFVGRAACTEAIKILMQNAIYIMAAGSTTLSAEQPVSGRVLTRMPSHLETARRGRSARKVRIERKAGMSSAPAITAPWLTSDN